MAGAWVPPDKRPYFGAAFRLICKDKGITHKWVAQKAGISENSLVGYVAGKHQPTLPAIEAISDVLDVSADVLLGRVPYESERYELIGEAVVEREID